VPVPADKITQSDPVRTSRCGVVEAKGGPIAVLADIAQRSVGRGAPKVTSLSDDDGPDAGEPRVAGSGEESSGEEGSGEEESGETERGPGPSELPGTGRLRRIAGSNSGGGGAYQGAMEAVMVVPVSIGIGYWLESRFGFEPWGVIGGAAIGFVAFVLRLVLMAPGAEAQDDSDDDG